MNGKRTARQDVTGLILAGGAGRRVGGADKGLLEWHGAPLVEHVLRRLVPQVGSIVISCNRSRERYAAFGFDTVMDDRLGFQGPLAGLEAATALVKTVFLVVVSCDTPDLPGDLVERLLVPIETGRSVEISYAWDGEQDHYLCAGMRAKTLESLPSYLDQGNRTVRHWYRRHRCERVDYSDNPGAFRNLNSP